MELIEARRLALELVPPACAEWVRLEEALGRVLAEPLTAHRNLPEEFRSRLDGFAVRSRDTSGASAHSPVILRVLPGVCAAGHAPHADVGPGECVRILTGAQLPPGADAVVPQEDATERGSELLLSRAIVPKSGSSVPGEDIRAGDLLLGRGEILTPTRLALIAALGHTRIPVTRQPAVALLATGDEVQELGAEGEGPMTFCNNRHLMAWLVRVHGGQPVSLGVVRDEPGAIADRLKDVKADLIITTGGMGQGDRDFILEVWRRIGVRELFHRINLSPGKSSALGAGQAQAFWGLPGNPWGAQVVFEELVAPMLWAYQGLDPLEVPVIRARAQSSLKKKPGFHKAVRGTLDLKVVPPAFTPIPHGSGSRFAGLRDCFAYTLLESHVVEVAAGAEVKVRLHDLPLSASSLLGRGDRSPQGAQRTESTR